jgi:hypothetical protein
LPEEETNYYELPAPVREELADEEDFEDSLYAKRFRERKKSFDNGFVEWGEMRIQPCPLTRSVKAKFSRRWKPLEEGVVPRYPHRYFIDKQIFAYRKRIPGGTVLIDGSGSMSLSHDEICQIVESAPGCVVAIYGGKGTYGILRILAKGGRCCESKWCKTPGGQNNIDFPALVWAMKHNHPRFWITDGAVTGIHDQSGAKNVLQCGVAAIKGKFFVRRRVPDAVELLQRLGKFYKKAN